MRMKILAEKSPWRNVVEIALAIDKDGRRFFAKPVEFSESSHEGQIVEPAMALEQEEAQELMDELWRCGLRPTEGSGSAGSLAATEKHLADMRKIAFHFIDTTTPDSK